MGVRLPWRGLVYPGYYKFRLTLTGKKKYPTTLYVIDVLLYLCITECLCRLVSCYRTVKMKAVEQQGNGNIDRANFPVEKEVTIRIPTFDRRGSALRREALDRLKKGDEIGKHLDGDNSPSLRQKVGAADGGSLLKTHPEGSGHTEGPPRKGNKTFMVRQLSKVSLQLKYIIYKMTSNSTQMHNS